METINGQQERRVRKLANGLGYRLLKDQRGIHLNNLGEYQLVNDRGMVVMGSTFDVPLGQIEEYLRDEAKS